MDEKKEKDECQAASDLPYPPVQAETHQRDYAYAMLSNIGSSNSEMSAVSRYFYNSVITNSDYGDFARCFHKIAIVEMHHLNIFATLALQSGADPRLWSLQGRRMAYWTPGFNNYPREIRAIIESSIRDEENAIRKYTRQSQTIRDVNIVENLNRIILDEQLHIETLQSMLEKIN